MILDEFPRSSVRRLHDLLLRIDSWLPDDLVVEARGWLGHGLVVDVAQAVAFAALSARVALHPSDVELLTRTLRDADADTSGLADLVRGDAGRRLSGCFAPVAPHVLAEYGAAVPHSLDLTGSNAFPGGLDTVDRAAVDAVAGLAGAEALWRCWRYPEPAARWPPPKRAYVIRMSRRQVEVLALVAAGIQERLAAAGETEPLVRVFTAEAGLPPYHRAALDFAALLWSAAPPSQISFAVPSAGRDAARLDEPERELVLGYLSRGVPLLISTELADDTVHPRGYPVAPTNVRTDGDWVWNDTVAYYLERYALAPDAALLAHIRGRGYRSAAVDEVALHRALAAVRAQAVAGVVSPSPRRPG